MLAAFAADRHGVRPRALGVRPRAVGVGHLDVDTILAFLDHPRNGRGNGVRTRNTRLAAIRSLFRFLEFRHPDRLDMAARVRAPPQRKGDVPGTEHLDRNEVKALLKAPDAATRPGTRDRAMPCLACNAGLRVSEPVGLGLDDVRTPRLDEVRVMGKGRRACVLPLWKETAGALAAWLAVRPGAPDRHLFLNASERGMTRRGFARRLDLHAATAARTEPSIAHRKVTPHVLRHACALNILEATSDIRRVSLWLGHQSLQTTEMYLRKDPAENRAPS